MKTLLLKTFMIVYALISFSAHCFADPKSNADIPDVPAFGEAERAKCPKAIPAKGTTANNYLAKWRAAGFINPEVTILNQQHFCTLPKSTKYTHQLKLFAVGFRNSQWQINQVQSRLLRVSEVYAQCGVKVTQATIVWADPYKGISDIEGVEASENSINFAIAKATPIQNRPVLYYVQARTNGGNAHAHPEFSIQGVSPLLNTVWITSEVESRMYRYVHDPRYSTDAHELGHILLDSSHYMGPEKNFLSAEIDGGNDQITAQQCDSIRKSNLISPL
jgi:hypothetical protein